MIKGIDDYRYYEITTEGVVIPKGSIEEGISKRMKVAIQRLKPEDRKYAKLYCYKDKDGGNRAYLFVSNGKKAMSQAFIYEKEEKKVNLTKLASVLKKDPFLSKYFKSGKPSNE